MKLTKVLFAFALMASMSASAGSAKQANPQETSINNDRNDTSTGTGSKSKSHHMMDMDKMSPEQKEKMAVMHEKMATCIRSNQPSKVCMEEMKSNCPMMGKEGCSMMGAHEGMNHGEMKK